MAQIAASIAHEINQPLTAIVTNGNAASKWLAKNPPNLEEVQASLNRVVMEGHRAGVPLLTSDNLGFLSRSTSRISVSIAVTLFVGP